MIYITLSIAEFVPFIFASPSFLVEILSKQGSGGREVEKKEHINI